MILALLLAQASAVDAERAFAAAAKRDGQWTAFRRYAAPEAILFWPEPVNAQRTLALLKNPPRAVEWSPAESFVSCDGMLAANAGPTRWPDGRTGYFSTIWAKQPAGDWKWTVDHGDAPAPTRWKLHARPVVRRGACTGKPTQPPEIAFRNAPKFTGKGRSADGTLAYFWSINSADARGFNVWLWNGSAWEQVVRDGVAPPKP